MCLKFSANPFTNFTSLHSPHPTQEEVIDLTKDVTTLTCEMVSVSDFFAWRNLWRPLTSLLLQWWYKKCQTCFLYSRKRIKTTFCNTANMYMTSLVEEIPIYIWQLTMLNIITMIIWHYKKPKKLGVLK